MIETLADAVDDGFLERRLIENGRIHERRQKRILRDRTLGFHADRIPDGIDRLEGFPHAYA